MDSNCKNKFNLDHVYCHPNDGGYIRANPGATDILALLKENKQLKAMLLLHLDLIQEQSDQLMAKDKSLSSLKEENESLKSRVEKLERRLQIKYSKSPETNNLAASQQINEIKTESISAGGIEPSSSSIVIPSSAGVNSFSHLNNSNNVMATTTAVAAAVATKESKYKICDGNSYTNDSIIGENNGKFISKIILQRVQNPNDVSIKEETDEQLLEQQQQQQQQQQQLHQHQGFLDNDQDHEDKYLTVKDLRSNSKTIELSMQNDTEDSFSCGSGDQDHLLGSGSSRFDRSRKRKRYNVMTTKNMYATREWEDQKLDEDANREEVEALKAEEPNLEIPKWTIKEFTGLYSIEGTEDLSDEVFLKRHAKLEHDEKRRKKWDVQRIREQRTIERLKRRHCKDELLQQQDAENNQEMISYYPSIDSIKYIQVVEDIPVQAFGDGIPRLAPKEFSAVLHVPGHHPTTTMTATTTTMSTTTTSSLLSSTSSAALTSAASTSAAAIGGSSSTTTHSTTLTATFDPFDMQPSFLAFLKKRRRQHSQSVTSGSSSARRIYKRPVKN